jgi:hypothetical protein
MEEKCGVCLSPEEWHKERAAANMATLLMMKQVSESLPIEYSETLDQILIDWRTHTLPTCDPSAIK